MTQTYTWRDLDSERHVSFLENPRWKSESVMFSSSQGVPQKVLRAFRLQPQSIEQHGHVFKIKDPRGQFALKKTKMTNEERQRLLMFSQIYQQSPIRMPKMIKTIEGDPFIQVERDTYYLMPWIQETESARSEQWEFLWDTLADWHRTTTKLYELEPAWIETFTERCLEVWSEQVLSLDLFMNDCEHRIYPSPFEQRFIAFYQDLRSGAEEGYRRMKTWQEQLSEQKQIRLVVCHGKPSPEHLIVSGRQRNWISTEASGMDLPIRDLIWFLRWGQNEKLQEAFWRGFDIYETTYPLEDHEKQLLLAHLCQPARVIHLLHRYKEQRTHLSGEREETIQLEKAFHQWGRTWQALSSKLEKQPTEETSKSSSESTEATKKE